MQTKRCPKCGEEKPLTDQHWSISKKTHKAHSWCKSCNNEYYRRHHPKKKRDVNICKVEDCNNIAHGKTYCNKHYIRWRKYGDPLKTLLGQAEKCPKCGNARTPVKDSHNHCRGKRLRCKNCDSERTKKWWTENREQLKERRKDLYVGEVRKRAINRAHVWYSANSQKAYERNKKRLAEDEEFYIKFRNMQKKWARKQIDYMSDYYIKRVLKRHGYFNDGKIIELKREQITLSRNIKKLRRMNNGSVD